MPPPITAAQIEAYAGSAQSLYNAAKDHPRYHLRSRSLKAIAWGSVLNFLSLLVAFIGRAGEAPRVVTVMAGVVYSISAAYQTLDLLCGSSASKGKDQQRWLFTRHIPSIYILAIDTLGFFGFLALLIGNGIVISNLYDHNNQIFVYNSVPWMICCAVHGYVAIFSVPTVLSEFWNGYEKVYCCAECKRESKKRHGKADDDDDDDDDGCRPLLLRDEDASEAV